MTSEDFNKTRLSRICLDIFNLRRSMQKGDSDAYGNSDDLGESMHLHSLTRASTVHLSVRRAIYLTSVEILEVKPN